jgi:hypothetical protein
VWSNLRRGGWSSAEGVGGPYVNEKVEWVPACLARLCVLLVSSIDVAGLATSTYSFSSVLFLSFLILTIALWCWIYHLRSGSREQCEICIPWERTLALN